MGGGGWGGSGVLYWPPGSLMMLEPEGLRI